MKQIYKKIKTFGQSINRFVKLAAVLAIIFACNGNAWALDEYVTVTDFNGSTTFNGTGFNSISGSNFSKKSNHVTFVINDVSYYNSLGTQRLDYSEQGKNKTVNSSFSWSAEPNYHVDVTGVSIGLRGYQAKLSPKSATAQFLDGTHTGTSVDCKTNSIGTSGASTVSISATPVITPLTLKKVTGGNSTTYTITTVTYTYKVTHKEYLFGFSANASANNNSYGTVSASVDNSTVQAGVGVTSASTTARFVATPATGCQFLGWYDNSSYSGSPVSTDLSYNTTLNNSTAGSTVSKTLYAKFDNKQNQSISWNQTISNKIRSNTVTLNATASSGLTVTYTASPSDLVSISGNVVTCLKAGTVTITANQIGNDVYHPSSNNPQVSFTIVEHAITTIPTATSITYEQTLSSSALSGGEANVAGTWAWKYPQSVPNAGTANQVAVFTPSSSVISAYPLECNVSVTVNKATPDVTCNIANEYYADAAALDLQSLWTREGNGAIIYSVVSFTPTGTNNEDATEPSITSNRYLSLGQAGALRIKMEVAEGANYTSLLPITKDITIKKYKPSFTWNTGNAKYYYQSNIKNVFTTTSPCDYTIVSDNEAVAKVIDGTLYVYNVEETARITVTQVENYLWEGKTQTYTVTPVELNNHVEFTITSSNHQNFEFNASFSDNASWSNSGYCLGDGGWSTRDNYVIIAFTGIPDKLYFDKSLETSLGQLPGTHLCQVYESYNGENWGEAIWTHDERVDNKNNNVVNLLPTTRYIKFAYHGTVYCNYTNIRVTELNKFEATPNPLDFGTKGINYGVQEEQITFVHANAGRVTSLELSGADKDYFSVERTTIAGTGRDMQNTVYIAVRFDNGDERRGNDPYNAFLTISDNAGHRQDVTLTAVRSGKLAPEFTWNANHLPYYFNTSIAHIASSTNTDYANCPLSFTTSNKNVAEVIDGTLHIYSTGEEVTITVRQDAENEDYSSGSAAFTFTPRKRPDLTVPFQTNQTIYNTAIEAGNKCGWDSEEGAIRVGNTNILIDDLIYSHSEKSFTIAFDGTPGRLSFSYKNGASLATGDSHMWEVFESANGSDWNRVWSDGYQHTTVTDINDLPLNPATRYLRFAYSGNYWGFYYNINVSELVGYKYLRSEEDGRYLSRGAKWGTQAIVDDFGMACRISRYTSDNTNIYTRFLFVDNQQYLFETYDQASGLREVFTDNNTAGNSRNLWTLTTIEGTVLTVQSGNDLGAKGMYLTLDGDAIAFTSDASQATHWQMEDYTEHSAYITDMLNREAAAAAAKDFGAEVNTLEKVRSRIISYDFDKTDIEIPAVTTAQHQGEYRNGVDGTYVAYDNTISGLKPGFYRVEVKAFYRVASSDVAWACHASGMESVLAYVYANDVNYPIQSLYNSYQANALEPEDEVRDGYFYSATMASAEKAFEDEKRYINDVYVYVNADEGKETGTLRYGIKNPSYVPGAWLVYGTFTLSRFARKEFIFEGTEENDELNWDDGYNWNRNITPDERHVVIIRHDVELDKEETVYRVEIENNAKVTILPTGGLTVGGGGIIGATKENLILKAGTEGETKGQTGFLRISPDYKDAMPEASVEMYSIGYYDKTSDEENVAAWQYIGAPIQMTALAKTVFTRSWIYSYVESEDEWVNNRAQLVMQPFVGYATTQYDSNEGKLMTYGGTLVQNRGTHTIDLAFTDEEHGHNMLANSFAAPIDVTNLRNSDFVNAEPTIYLFNTGSRSQALNNAGTKGNTPGQFIPIAIGTAKAMEEQFKGEGLPTTIAPMQGFSVNAIGAGASVTLDYDKLVWKADYSEHPNAPLHIVERRTEVRNNAEQDDEEAVISGALMLSIQANGWSDNCYLLESEAYEDAFEMGFDARKMQSGNLNVFTLSDSQQLAIKATNSIVGTRVGVRTGEETAYTLCFTHMNSDNELALFDAETGEKIFINEGTEYTFYAEPNSEILTRFQIVERANAPAITTDVENVTNGENVHKFIKDNQLYILKNGVLYNATGAVVR